jgi:hypothetical protein
MRIAYKREQEWFYPGFYVIITYHGNSGYIEDLYRHAP